MDALETAKKLPDLAAKIEILGETIIRVKDGLQELEQKLPDSEIWTEKLENLKRLALDLQETLDQLPANDTPRASAPQVSGEKVDPREEIGNIWSAIKAHVEGLIEGLHGNRRKTYASIRRYRYDEIADMLLYDRKISEKQHHALIQANARFLSLRNRRLELAKDDLGKFRSWKELLEIGDS